MKNCLICNINLANKKGSHVIPHFLLKRINNEKGKVGRDKEIGFVITPKQTISYFGRNVLPEKLEEIYGEITDDLIQNNSIKGIVDNYFCSSCESNLSVIESEYAKSLNEKPKINQVYESSVSGFIAFLFWASIIWRLSIQDYSGFKLKPKEEKKLNRILKKYLKNSLIDIKPDSLDLDLSDIGYKLLRSPHYSSQNSTWLHWQPNYERPYSIMIDEYILFLYFKRSHLKGMVMDFYGSENLKNKAKFNKPTENESVFSVPHEEYSILVENIKSYGVKKVIKELDTTLDKIHQRLGQKGKMNLQLKMEIKKRIANSEAPLGKKFALENQAKIIYETLSEYFVNNV